MKKDAPQVLAALGESPLEDLDLRFVEEYCVDLNPKKAMVRAGQSPETAATRARVMLRKPEIQQAIDMRLAELSKHSVINAEWVRAKLKENVERCMQAVPVMEKVRGEGGKMELIPTGEYEYEATAAIKALELLGKHLGMFAEHSTVTVEHELKQLTNEQLQARIARMAEEHTALTLIPGADGVFAAPVAAEPAPALLEEKKDDEPHSPLH